MSLPADEIDWRIAYEASIAEKSAIDFAQFTHGDAWALGSSMVVAATTHGLPVVIANTFGARGVFNAALAGTSATNDDWLARKFRAVTKFNCSSWASGCAQRADGSGVLAEGGYRRADLALAGGAVPLRVRGSLIGAVGVSGLAEDADHRFVIKALRGCAQPPSG
jgi:uncharacterized protein (UPF0303 family)